jgi:serine/threonine-protein kinase
MEPGLNWVRAAGTAIMTATSRSETSSEKLSEERLAHALVSRGLVTRDEVQLCRASSAQDLGAEAFLSRLVRAGFLTANQARRASQELATLLGQQIPGFELQDRLGQGTMGIVYKANQLSMNRLVAIKVLQPRLAANRAFLERFTREAHSAARLSHNNIVQAFDVGSAGSLHYLIMEYVEGTTIKQELEAGKVYNERVAVEIVLQIAQALQHAHRRGLIHRDIKPANIILTPDGVAKLADLGLARQTNDEALDEAERGMTIGTPFYICPEQIRGEETIDIRADIYSLGATFYHMVTGHPPFPGKKVDAVLHDHLEKELTPPDHLNTSLSAGVGEVIEIMMAKDRAQRYPTPGDLLIDLECLLSGQPPKLARQRIAEGTLAQLARGEAADDDDDEAEGSGAHRLWLGVLGGLLGLSVVLNVLLFVVLFLRR